MCLLNISFSFISSSNVENGALCVLFFVFAWALCNDGAMVGRHWCYFLHVFFFLVAFLHSPFFHSVCPVVFLVILFAFVPRLILLWWHNFSWFSFTCFFSAYSLAHKSCVNAVLLLHSYRCFCMRVCACGFFFSLFEAMHGESHRIKIPAIVFSLHVWATEIVSFEKFKR